MLSASCAAEPTEFSPRPQKFCQEAKLGFVGVRKECFLGGNFSKINSNSFLKIVDEKSN